MSAILVYGPAGSGKSTASRNLPAETTGIICTDSKPLPFRGWKKKYITQYGDDGKPSLAKSNYVETKKPASILKTLRVWEERKDIWTIVWDTMTHAIMYRFMTDPKVDWDFYKILAREIYEILNFIQTMKTDVIVIGHNDTKFDASTGGKIDAVRTIGRLLDEKVDIPSLFTVVFTTAITKDSDGRPEYSFRTQTDGSNFAKSPMGMFEELTIPNDYNLILTRIHKYYDGN